MKVLVTGGTGFVGSHSVAALQSAGHDLRLLARTPGKVEQVLGPLGVSLDEIEVVPGDATDEAAVDAAVRGCAAVLNCVSMVSLSRHDEDAVRSVNIRSAEVVLGAATRAGLDPVVHVSSVSALLPPAGGAVLTADAEVGEPPGGYMRSKAEADRAARRRQADGLPVVLTYPTMVVGPHDPTMGEGMGMLARVLRGHVPALPPGGMEMIDVRDLA
ncbi:MAG: hypothetical protein QOG64_2571 [Acidimicrobiaceae bacterium]|nr:hypothetical protein [Acidimicrobiaceae bacterium]